jgi:ABC-type uncharacterized transport system involved in gliding motility auxiliary subunit
MPPGIIIIILLAAALFLIPFVVKGVRTRFFWDSVNGVVLGFIAFCLVLAISHSNEHPIDVTKSGQYTLSEQTAKVVGELKDTIKIYAFIGDTSKAKADELLKRYQRLNSSKVSFELVNVSKKPAMAKAYDIHQTGIAVIEVQSGEASKPTASPSPDESSAPPMRRERANSIGEEDITNAILKLNRTGEAKIYSLTGHGEKAVDDTEKSGISKLKIDLSKEGLVLQPLSLTKEKAIPADCRALLIAGPTSPLLPAEEKIVQEYLKNQGRLLIALEPESPADYNKLLEPYGIAPTDRVILDEASSMVGAEPFFALGQVYDQTNPITRGFKQVTVFLLARPIEITGKAPKGAQVTAICKTADSCMTIPAADVVGQKELRIETGKTPPAQLNLAVTGSYPSEDTSIPSPSPTPGEQPKKKPEARLVVVGDSDLFTNSLLKQAGSKDLALNMFNWLAETENQISIRPKDAESAPLRMTGNETTTTLIIYVFIIPICVAFTGFFMAWRRR